MNTKSSLLKDFQIIQKLGQGSFSSVYKVKKYDTNIIYALKKVKIGQMYEKDKQNALNQVRILASISHPNIINYKDAFFDDSTQTLCLVMEIAESGDILNKIDMHMKQKTYFKEAEIWKALLHMTKGLKSLHDMNIMHRDLKCANVFCSLQGVYKLGDLNVSKVTKKGMARTHTGTPYYTSPQVWKQKPYDYKCDIWSLGCVLYEMAALNPPFRASNLKQLYNKIQKGIFQRIPSFYSDDLSNLINLCMKVNPSLRPSTSQILARPQLIKNVSPAQLYQSGIRKSNSLLKTINVPKNLNLLKQALPGAKYNQFLPQKIDSKRYYRINSARSLEKESSVVKFTDLKTPKLSNKRIQIQSAKKIQSSRIQMKYQQRLKSFQHRKQSSSKIYQTSIRNPKIMAQQKSRQILRGASKKYSQGREVREKIYNILADRNKQNKRSQDITDISPNVKKAIDQIKKSQKNYREMVIQRMKSKQDLKPRSQSFDKDMGDRQQEQAKKKYNLIQKKNFPPRKQRL